MRTVQQMKNVAEVMLYAMAGALILIYSYGCASLPQQAAGPILAPGETLTVACVAPEPGPGPTPQPEPEPQPPPAPDLILLRGETAELVFPGPGCPALSVPAGLEVEPLEFRPIVTERPTFLGARVGEYLDALVPCETGARGVWLDVTGRTAGRYVLAGKHVLVLPADLPAKPTLPAYAEIRFSNIATATHGIPDTSETLAERALLVKRYIAFLRAHRIEPIKQAVRNYSSANPTEFIAQGADFLSLAIDGAIAPPMLLPFLRDPYGPTAAQLQAIEGHLRSGLYPVDSWAYPWDEGQPGELLALLKRVGEIRKDAPTLSLWPTWEPIPEIVDRVDGFIPVGDWFKAPGRVQAYPKPYGLYTSCMAHGNCTGASPRNPTGTNMFVVEADGIHQEMFSVVVYALGGKKALYYAADSNLSTAWRPGGLWRTDGMGNGDGTLLYPGPAASVRLKYWRSSQNSVEYLKLLGEDGSALVKSPREWNHDRARLFDLRLRLARKLGAL